MKNYRLYILPKGYNKGHRQELLDRNDNLIYEKLGADDWQIAQRRDLGIYYVSGLSKAFLERTPPNKEYDTIEEFIADNNFEEFL